MGRKECQLEAVGREVGLIANVSLLLYISAPLCLMDSEAIRIIPYRALGRNAANGLAITPSRTAIYSHFCGRFLIRIFISRDCGPRGHLISPAR